MDDNFLDHFKRFLAIIVLMVVVLGGGIWAVQYFEIKPTDNSVLGFLAITAIIVAFAGAVLWNLVNGTINLTGIIAEPREPERDANGKQVLDENNKPVMNPGKASLSRFQFLLFTFVVAGVFLMLSIESGAFVEIPSNVLGLLGISGGSYVISKTVGMQKDK